MAAELERSNVQKTFEFVAKALLVAIIATMPIGAAVGFAVLTGRI